MEYDNNNTGVLFRNLKKDPNDPEDRKPDYTGQGEINGTEYWLSAWKRTSKAGAGFQSIKFQLKNEPINGEPQKPTFIENERNEDLPF